MLRFAIALLSLLTATVLFWSGPAMAADAEPLTRVYEGSVGSSPIVMSLDVSDGDASGQYFYRGKWFDIPLLGDAKKGGVLQLKAEATGDQITLKPEGEGYAGTLTTAKRKTLPVQLRFVSSTPSIPAQGDSSTIPLNAYEKIRVAGLALKPEKTETIEGRSLRWYVEPASRLRLFRIESGYEAPALEKINSALERIQWREISDYYACLGSDGGPGALSAVEHIYLSDAYVSFQYQDSQDCAGTAHPDEGIEGHSFDARTGKELDLDEVLSFRKGPALKKDSDAWYDYRSKVFEPAIVGLLKREYPKQMKKSAEDCDYTDVEVWNFPQWRMTPKGVYVSPSFPHVAGNCNAPEWPVIPYSALKDLKAP